MSTGMSHERFTITAAGPGGESVPVAFHVTYAQGADDPGRTAMILPHQRHSFLRQYGHEDGWRVKFEALLELPEELLLSWSYTQLRQWVAKDNLTEFDAIATRAIMSQRDSEEK